MQRLTMVGEAALGLGAWGQTPRKLGEEEVR